MFERNFDSEVAFAILSKNRITKPFLTFLDDFLIVFKRNFDSEPRCALVSNSASQSVARFVAEQPSHLMFKRLFDSV